MGSLSGEQTLKHKLWGKTPSEGISAPRRFTGSPVATSCHLLQLETEGETWVWAGRVRGNGQEQMSQRANQLAVYVCARMQQDQSIFCKRAYTHTLHLARKNTRTHRSPLKGPSGLCYSAYCCIARWNVAEFIYFSFVHFLLMRTTIGFVQMKKHYVFSCKEPKALKQTISSKTRLEELEGFLFLCRHTNRRSDNSEI